MNWDPANADPAVGSFMPGLQWVVDHTVGPILELGGGYFSTPYLHGVGRTVWTYEGYDKDWYVELFARFARYEENEHRFVSEFADVPELPWSVVLIDCEGWSRQPFFDAIRPKTPGATFVIHDNQDHWVKWEPYDFEYQYHFGDNPSTVLLSDVLDVRRCDV